MATDRRRNAVEDKQELATTIGLYVLSEISLGKAAERTGVTRWGDGGTPSGGRC